MENQQSQRNALPFDIIEEEAKLAHSIHRDEFRFINQAAIEASATAAKALLITNGGAVIAMLGFVATISGGNGDVRLDIYAASDALIWFASGVAASILVSLLAYLVHYFQAEAEAAKTYSWNYPYVIQLKGSERFWRARNYTHLIAVITAVAALICFVKGIVAVSDLIATATTVGGANCHGQFGGWWFFCQS
ncbi:hypothetical protein RA28_16440 [Ruegeria sp. ANG-S4]|uniref:hypothetical protein n=1 Tax=Ruegeria sp. ANG-S4 TaxID=1577904 RepID=UPI00057EB2DC|nr:hypothetical protein [Ruegeria sp. ANG-S4]KIC44494.1 hypothetical protein RA28_16440 [Ruegeria sp. ANG-S4]